MFSKNVPVLLKFHYIFAQFTRVEKLCRSSLATVRMLSVGLGFYFRI